MPGLAKTKSFMLSTATVMIGPAEDLLTLNPAEHSIGLVKNFQMTADPTFVELTQGINNVVVMSIKNNEGLRCSMEVYEYTLRNLAYAAGLDASGTSFDPMDEIWVTKAIVNGGGDSITVDDDISDDIKAGDFIFLQNGLDDRVHIAKVKTSAHASDETTITFAEGYETPTSMDFPAGARIGKVQQVKIGGTAVQAEMGVKIVGLLPKDNAPFTILLPKAKVTRGLGVAFQSDNFGNLPFELTPYAGVPGDPMYDEFGEAVAVLFPR